MYLLLSRTLVQNFESTIVQMIAKATSTKADKNLPMHNKSNMSCKSPFQRGRIACCYPFARPPQKTMPMWVCSENSAEKSTLCITIDKWYKRFSFISVHLWGWGGDTAWVGKINYKPGYCPDKETTHTLKTREDIMASNRAQETKMLWEINISWNPGEKSESDFNVVKQFP